MNNHLSRTLYSSDVVETHSLHWYVTDVLRVLIDICILLQHSHWLPAIKLKLPDFLWFSQISAIYHKISMVKKELEKRQAESKALPMPHIDQCPPVAIKQVLCQMSGWQWTCKGWAFQCFLLTWGLICFGWGGRKKLQHPEHFWTNKDRAPTMRHDASE